MTRESCFERLEQLILDERRTLTFKGVSRELRISVTEAIQYLQEFIENQESENLNATYFVSGTKEKDTKSPLKVFVVDKNNLEKTKESLFEVTSCHIYSVSKYTVNAGSLHYADKSYNTTDEENGYGNYVLIKQPNIEIKRPFLSKTAAIKEVKTPIPKKEGTSFFKRAASNLDTKNKTSEPAERNDVKETAVKSVENGKSKTQSPVKKSNSESKVQKPNTLASMWKKSEEKSKKNDNLPSDGKSKTKSPQEAKQTPKNNIMSMFSKQAEKNVDSSTKKSSPLKKSSISASSSKAEENISSKEKSNKSENSNEPEEVKEKKSTKPPTDKKKKVSQRQTKSSKHKKEDESDDEFQPKKKKHRRICTYDSDSESESEETQDKARRNLLLAEEPMETELLSKPSTLASDDEEPIPPTPPVVSSKGKKKVWKTVQKTFEDEDGFFVTKQEKVLVSEDDEDPLPQSSKSKEVNKPNQFTYRKQASLTSFFKQK